MLESLRDARGPERNDYPVEVLWGTLVLAIVLRHISTDACIEHLKRNPALRLLIGIEATDAVPDADNMLRCCGFWPDWAKSRTGRTFAPY